MSIKNKKIFTPLVWCTKFVGRHFPETLVRIRYFARFKRRLNLNNPQTLNEKILYMSLRTDTTSWTRLADKYNVRGYIEECGLSDILVPLLGYWESAEQIDFDKLPNQFVLKSTHGCGDIIVVKDKSKINLDEVRKRMSAAVSEIYGELEGGKHYMRIKPAIIAEGLLVNDELSAKYSSSLIDYKFWCFNGKAHYVRVYCNRGELTDVMTYDMNWVSHPEYSVLTKEFKPAEVMSKPKNFDLMVKIAEQLGKPFPVVRVDLYNINGNIYFGELTFTSHGGMMNNLTEDFQRMCGDLIDINYKG